jgi:hypothetical protein
MVVNVIDGFVGAYQRVARATLNLDKKWAKN